jgi:hypothetical protein
LEDIWKMQWIIIYVENGSRAYIVYARCLG